MEQNQSNIYYQNKEIEDLIESNWISIKDNETRVLQFIPDKSKVVDKRSYLDWSTRNNRIRPGRN
jgi:hypothetical protein